MTTNSASDVSLPPLQSTNLNPTLSQLPSSISQLQGSTVGPSLQEQQLQLLSPTGQQAMTGAQQAAALGMPIGQNLYTGGQGIYNTGTGLVNTGQQITGQGQQVFGEANSIFPYAQQTFQTALDPQSQLYNWLQNQNMQQTQAENAMSGVGTTPYGADVANQSNMLFNINWQNQQLQRQIEGLQAGAGAIQTGAGIQQAGTGIEATGAGVTQAGTGVQQAGLGLETQAPSFISGTSAIPYATRSGITGTSLQDIAAAAQNQNIPITDLLNFLSGQNQTNTVANQTAQLGLNQSALEMMQMAGLASGAGSLFGGLLGGSGTGLSALGSGLGKVASAPPLALAF
jgi:hypothetical protein